MITRQFLIIWLLFVNIISFKEILVIFLILRRSSINEVRLQNLYPDFVNIASNSGDNTGIHFFRPPVLNHNFNEYHEVKHDKCD